LVNVLVIGSGGREHAIGWKLGQSDNVNTIFYAPGNGGTLNNVPISADNLGELAKFASENNCFTVVGPEVPLAMGIVDMFNEMGLKIFGPTKKAAQLESSKIWAKQFLKRNNIPTAAFEVFNDAVKAKEYVNQIEYNVVIKADGLAAGKGVIVCDNKAEAEKSIDMMLVDKKFGDAGNNIIIEERIDGIEASYIALSDGKIAIPMATSQDHKRIFDNDKGPNTGGMGAYSPTPIIDKDLSQKIQDEFCSRILFRRSFHSVSKVSIFSRPIAAALHGRAAYHHDRLHEKSIIGLAPLTVRPFALTRPNPNLSIISWRGRQASCEVHKLGFEELGACF